MKEYYDVVVVGAQPPALLSAALLANRGFRVLVLEHDTPPPTYEAGRFTLPRAPFSFLARHSPHARQALSELALLPTLRQRTPATDPLLQISTPGHRFDIPTTREGLLREVSREFEDTAAAIMDVEDALKDASVALGTAIDATHLWPPAGYFGTRAFARRLRASQLDPVTAHDPFSALRPDHPYRAAILAPARFASFTDPDRMPLLQLARLHSAWRDGLARFADGEVDFRRLLVERITAHGGNVRSGERVERILTRRNRAYAVRTVAHTDELGAEHVILGTDVGSALRLFVDRAPIEQLFEDAGEPQPRYFRYTLNLVVRPEAIPDAMAPNVFHVRDPNRPLVSENALRIEMGDVEGSDAKRLTVEALVPRRGIEEVAGFVTGLRDRVVASLGELLPFLGRHTIFIDSPHDGRDAQDLELGEAVPPRDPWARGPTSMTPLTRFARRHGAELCALPVQTPLRNVLLANSQVVPGLGMEGDFVTALAAAARVEGADRRRRWVRRTRWIEPAT
ncbi:MAG: hypothetical protein KC417_00190 [Myxococcales bacterium]|nr:hypothetical protein [Myxococcales bacterium]